MSTPRARDPVGGYPVRKGPHGVRLPVPVRLLSNTPDTPCNVAGLGRGGDGECAVAWAYIAVPVRGLDCATIGSLHRTMHTMHHELAIARPQYCVPAHTHTQFANAQHKALLAEQNILISWSSDKTNRACPTPIDPTHTHAHTHTHTFRTTKQEQSKKSGCETCVYIVHET